jgi:hypothetical protein
VDGVVRDDRPDVQRLQRGYISRFEQTGKKGIAKLSAVAVAQVLSADISQGARLFRFRSTTGFSPNNLCGTK